jgi:hypothetical protein
VVLAVPAKMVLTIHSCGSETKLKICCLRRTHCESASVRSSMTHEEESTGCVAERVEIVPSEKSKDQDRGKGAVEQNQKNEGGNTSMNGQLDAGTKM